MKEKKAVVTNETVNTPDMQKKVPSMPKTLTVRKDTLVRVAIGTIAAVAILLILDWIIQTSITSQYVAFYKNADVSRSAYIKEMERQYGDQVVNEMLAKAAIAQAAKEKNLTISDEDVNAAVEADKKRAGITTDEDFTNALSQNGITLSDYRAYVKVTVTLDKLIEGTVTAPTDQEIQQYFTENKTLYEGKKLEEVKDTIREEIIQATLNTKRQEWITSALAGYNTNNNSFVTKESRQYKFLRSLELVKRLFSNDPTK